jgi:hypothetical protein
MPTIRPVFRLAQGGGKLRNSDVECGGYVGSRGSLYLVYFHERSPKVDEWRKVLIISFIWLSTIVFLRWETR